MHPTSIQNVSIEVPSCVHLIYPLANLLLVRLQHFGRHDCQTKEPKNARELTSALPFQFFPWLDLPHS